MRGRRWGVVVVGLLAAGCGSSGGGSPIPIDDLQSQYVTSACAYLVRCNFVSDTEICSWLFTSIAQSGSFNSLGASIAATKAGKSRYDGAAARHCLDTIANLSCTAQSSTIDAACQKLFAGTLTDGSRCIADTECLAGSFCAIPAATTGAASCDGTCVPGGTLCNDDTQCSGGQVCDTTAMTATSNGTCVAPVPPGATGAPCGTGNACQAGLFCSTVVTPSACTPVLRAGATCTYTPSGCAAGLRCVQGDDGSASTCMTVARKGETCQVLAQCGGNVSTLVCDETTHTCVDAPKTGPCAGAGTNIYVCDIMTSYCDFSQTTPTCTAYKAAGDSCNPSATECGALVDATMCQATVAGATTGTCVTAVPVLCTP